MKLEVGMYVRNVCFGIGKINRSYKDENGKVWYNVKFKCFEDNENHCGICEQTKGFKASHNIIDLITVGDYVNGVEVEEITDNEIMLVDTHLYINKDVANSLIETVMTKEFFENNCYKVGD